MLAESTYHRVNAVRLHLLIHILGSYSLSNWPLVVMSNVTRAYNVVFYETSLSWFVERGREVS